MYIDLTNKQIKILEFIKDKFSKKGYPPTIRELCSYVGLRSTSTVHSHLNKLEELGYIKRDPTKPRAIELLERESNLSNTNQEIIELPVIEFFENDMGIEENIVDTMKLPANMILGKSNFIYKVVDDKLIEIGIVEEDSIIVEETKNINNGRLFIGKLDNKIILGRYFKSDSNIKIQFENCFLDPITVNVDELEVIGQIRGHFRIIT